MTDREPKCKWCLDTNREPCRNCINWPDDESVMGRCPECGGTGWAKPSRPCTECDERRNLQPCRAWPETKETT